jgi:plasmid replication initiation protein
MGSTNEHFDSNDLTVKKSNALISAKYRTTLLENKILAIALTRLEVHGDSMWATMYPGELKQILGNGNDTNIYKKLKRIAKTMIGHHVVIEDGQGNFKAFSMITNVEYVGRVFKIVFNKELIPYVYQLRSNYTTFSLATLVGFSKNSSWRIYELLRKEIYREKFTAEEYIKKEFDIFELRFMIGLVNTDEEGVKRAEASGKSWEEIYEKYAIEKQYQTWYDFKTRVLEPAQKELEIKSDIRFEFRGIRMGVGGKVRRIEFTIWKNEINDVIQRNLLHKVQTIEEKNSEYRQVSLTDAAFESIYCKYVNHNALTREDIELMLEVAEYDGGKVERAIKMADQQPHLKNYIGWILQCIKDGYAEPIEVVEGSVEKAAKIRQLMDDIRSPEVIERVWMRAKGSDEYKEFVAYLEGGGISEDIFEYGYDTSEKVDLFFEWKKQNNAKPV